MHCVWGIQGQLQGDVTTGGVAHDVCLLDSQVTHQRPTVGSLLCEADGACYMAAARAADATRGVVLVTALPLLYRQDVF
jgi:hypothetical protein